MVIIDQLYFLPRKRPDYAVAICGRTIAEHRLEIGCSITRYRFYELREMLIFSQQCSEAFSFLIAPDLYRLLHGEVWRLLSSFFVFQSSAQAIVGLILLYTCRQFERQMGSRKFGAFIVFSFLVSTLVSLGVVVTASSIGFYLVPSSGPFSLIYALLIFYYCKLIVADSVAATVNS